MERLAHKHGIKVWVGMMVGSTLASNMASHLLPFVDVGCDLDGTLLVTPETDMFSEGFVWKDSKIVLCNGNGIGVRPKENIN